MGDVTDEPQVIELRLGYRYVRAHPWTVQAVNGFLSAYFMEHPGFRVQRHADELESGMHVWLCEIPPAMNMKKLVRRLQADIPPFRCTEPGPGPGAHPQFILDNPDTTDSA
ncbi:MAG TPA: hypothetical protein VKP13_18180 [Nitrospira sp.]|nr:hypothetical protein [Nitrospira sp.]